MGGDDMFIPIGAGAAAEEAWEDVGEPEVEEESPPEASSAYVPVNDLSEMTDTPDAEVVPESASGDALLGQAIPLETRLFLEVLSAGVLSPAEPHARVVQSRAFS